MKVGFFNNVKTSGGHEHMLVHLISGIDTSDLELVVYYYQGNTFLAQAFQSLKKTRPEITFITVDFYCDHKSFLTDLLHPHKLISLSRMIKKQAFDAWVVVQGEIELSLMGLFSGKLAAINTISYMPQAHSKKWIHAKWPAFRDALDSLYYRLPDRFITVSQSMKKVLARRGISKEHIGVVYNGIDFNKLNKVDKHKARTELQLDGKKVMGLIGRVSSKNKGHRFVLETMAKHRTTIEKLNLLVLFVGDGPDSERLKQWIQEFQLQDHARQLSHQKDLSQIYSALDMLIIPSTFEGVPLVMLEALYYKLPVVATAVDGMKELLPEECLFELNDQQGFIEKISEGFNPDFAEKTHTKLTRLRERLYNEFDLKYFANQFGSTLHQLVRQK